jgi:hypothetical protein
MVPLEDNVSRQLLDLYQVREWKHASTILANDYPNEWQDITEILTRFRLRKSDILTPGGAKSPIAKSIDRQFYDRGWTEKKFHTKITVDHQAYRIPTHSVDCFKSRVAIEVEWNNKTPFYDRDLNNFRLLFDLRVIDAGVIITRSDELQRIFDELGKGKSYGKSTTIVEKLYPLIDGGGGGGCPILVFAITEKLYEPDL